MTELAPVAALILMSPQGRVLMMRRVDDGTWAFPAGGVKQGESLEQAAFRECTEETGFRPGAMKLFMRRQKDGVDCSTFITQVDSEFEPVRNHEHDAHAWLEPTAVIAAAKGTKVSNDTFADDADAQFLRELEEPF